MKRSGTRYNSRWDASTFLMLALVIAVCIWPVFIAVDVWFIVLTFFFIGLILLIMLGIYYRIDGDKLIVYQFFRPTVFPIAKISEIKPTKSVLSSPATSLTHRIAIKFSDRRILKSTIPLIISPVRQHEFIAQLLLVNPDINVLK